MNPSKLRRLPSLIFGMVARSYYSRRNYELFLKSGEKAVVGQLQYRLDTVQQQFTDAGYRPEDYFVDIDSFNAFCLRHEGTYKDYKIGYGELFIEKALEHFVSLSFTPLSSTSRIIDIANAGSPFPEVVHSTYGCDVWSNDLILPKNNHRKNWHRQIEGDACALPIKDDFFDLAVLHCALEMFEGRADIDLILEAGRILKPGGKLVILPLYMNETYHILRDPRTHRNPLPEIDDDAELIYCENFGSFAFARYYNLDAFLKRLVNNSSRFELSIYRVRNLPEVNPKCYLNWIAVFNKIK